MATRKEIKGIIIPRHDTAINWSKAVNFTPENGELIVISADDTADVARGYYLDTQGNKLTTVTVNSNGINTVCAVEPSDKVRFKFGNGKDNVNALPFAAAQADGYVTYDEMVAYVASHGGAGGDGSNIVVYLDEERVMGQAIKMDDVYPIQHDMEFEIRSRNLFNPWVYHVDGEINVDTSSDYFTGTAVSASTITFDDIELPTEGDFTFWPTTGGNTSQYLKLFNDTELIYTHDASDLAGFEFNAKDLGVNRAVISATVSAGVQFSVNAMFCVGKILDNPTFTPYTEELSNISVNAYGRNLLASIENVTVPTSASINGPDIVDQNLSGTSDSLGQKYFHCYGMGCTFGDTTTSTAIGTTPTFVDNTEYTVLYTVLDITDNIATLGNFQVVLGHITEAPYEEYLCNTVTSDENGKLSNEYIQYPYCSAVLATNNSDVTIYAKYDPAINQDTIDSQFEEINKRLDALEAGGGNILIDQNFDPESEKAQSGKAVAEALETTAGIKTTEGGEIFNLYEDTSIDIGTINEIDLGKQIISKNVANKYSHAEGVGTAATGTGSHAEGIGTSVSSEGSHAEGAGVLVTGTGSHGEGRGVNFNLLVTDVQNNVITVEVDNSSVPNFEGNSIEVGLKQASFKAAQLKAIKKNAIIYADGYYYYVTEAETNTLYTKCTITLDRIPTRTDSGGNSHSTINTQSVVKVIMGAALSNMSHVEGNYCITCSEEDGDDSRQHAEGSRTLAIGYASHAEGEYTIAKGNKSHAEGNQTTTLGTDSHAEGYKTKTTATDAHAEGNTTEANGQASHAEGMRTKANGKGSHTEGLDTIADGEAAHAEGNETVASGNASHAEGARYTSPWTGTVYELIASGIGSHAEGGGSKAIGDYSHAEGQCGEASGKASHVEGSDCKATNQYAHAEGRYTEASGQNAHSEGNETVASGNRAHAEGNKTTASGGDSHAECYSTTASGENSHAEGSGSKSIGNASHAEGKGTEARGKNSHSGGLGTIASGDEQTAIGRYNQEDTNALFIIGNGSETNRKNAFTVKENGSAELQTQGTSDNSICLNSKFKFYSSETDIPDDLPEGTLVFIYES